MYAVERVKVWLTHILLARRDRPPAAPPGRESEELWEKVELNIFGWKRYFVPGYLLNNTW